MLTKEETLHITKFCNFRAGNGNGGGCRDRLANKQDKLFVTVKGQHHVSKHLDCCVYQESNGTKVIRVEFDNKRRNLFYNHECTESRVNWIFKGQNCISRSLIVVLQASNSILHRGAICQFLVW